MISHKLYILINSINYVKDKYCIYNLVYGIIKQLYVKISSLYTVIWGVKGHFWEFFLISSLIIFFLNQFYRGFVAINDAF